MFDRVLGFVQDLSAGGMKLLASAPLVDAALYQMHFTLDLPNEGRIPLEAGVQVVSQRSTPAAPAAALTRPGPRSARHRVLHGTMA